MQPSLSDSKEDLFKLEFENAVGVPVQFYLGFVVEGVTGEPPSEQYDSLRVSTIDFINETLTELYSADPDSEFLGFEFFIVTTDFGRGLPRERFNIYVECSSKTFFDADGVHPDTDELLAVLRASISVEYVQDFVWGQVGGAFASTSEVVLRRVPNTEPTAEPSAQPSASSMPTWEPGPAVESKQPPSSPPNARSGNDPASAGSSKQKSVLLLVAIPFALVTFLSSS